jgi:hypothetical protein
MIHLKYTGDIAKKRKKGIAKAIFSPPGPTFFDITSVFLFLNECSAAEKRWKNLLNALCHPGLDPGS